MESERVYIQGLQVFDWVRVDHLRELQLYPDDVWVVTYPKCGTTWTQQIVRLIRSNGELSDVNMDTAIPWLEGRYKGDPELDIDKLTRPRAFKSHFPYDLMPCGAPNTTPCKYIYVARNPKDVVVSYYHHMKLANEHGLQKDEFVRRFLDGDVAYGSYFDHLLSWLPHTNDENVLFLKYEDMKKNLPQTVRDIASFLGAELSDDVFAKTIDLSSLEKMRADKTANKSWVKKFTDSSGKPAFIRKGVVGDWKNFLTLEQSAQIDRLCAEKLRDTALFFEFQ